MASGSACITITSMSADRIQPFEVFCAQQLVRMVRYLDQWEYNLYQIRLKLITTEDKIYYTERKPQ